MSTIIVNNVEMPEAHVVLIFAKGALKILSMGMTIRNVSLTKIKKKLASEGIVLKGRTHVACLAEVEELLSSYDKKSS